MHFDQSPYFNRTLDACRRAGRVGGRRSGRNRRLREAQNRHMDFPSDRSRRLPFQVLNYRDPRSGKGFRCGPAIWPVGVAATDEGLV